ncbi:MAG: hypothetical protein PHX61_02510 [Alphaproteobacteria bacterium]|nr:hypothetical protein [Alphaproteobacteria bacterium]
MSKRIFWICIVIIMMIILPAAATEQYIENRSFDIFSAIDGHWNNFENIRPSNYISYWNDVTELGIYYELKHQSISIDEQNKLLAEQVKAQWIETCYAPKYKGGYEHHVGNISAWKLECAKAGYIVG